MKRKNPRKLLDRNVFKNGWPVNKERWRRIEKEVVGVYCIGWERLKGKFVRPVARICTSKSRVSGSKPPALATEPPTLIIIQCCLASRNDIV